MMLRWATNLAGVYTLLIPYDNDKRNLSRPRSARPTLFTSLNLHQT